MPEITDSLEILEARGINPNWYQQYRELTELQETIMDYLRFANQSTTTKK